MSTCHDATDVQAIPDREHQVQQTRPMLLFSLNFNHTHNHTFNLGLLYLRVVTVLIIRSLRQPVEASTTTWRIASGVRRGATHSGAAEHRTCRLSLAFPIGDGLH